MERSWIPFIAAGWEGTKQNSRVLKNAIVDLVPKFHFCHTVLDFNYIRFLMLLASLMLFHFGR